MLALPAPSKVLLPQEMVNHGSQIEIIVMNVPPATILSTVVSRLWSKLTGGRLDGRGACGPPPPGGWYCPCGYRSCVGPCGITPGCVGPEL